MADRDASGRFAPGNKITKVNCNLRKEAKKNCAAKLYEAIDMFDEEVGDLKAELENPKNTKWRYLCLNALNQKNFKFFMWCVEMMLGRPSQNVEMQTSDTDSEKLKEEIYILRDQLAAKHEKEY